MSKPRVVSVWKQWPIILSFMKPYWLACSFVVLLLIGDAIFDLSVAFAQGYFVDSINTSNQAAIVRITLMMTAALLGFIVLLAVHRYILVRLQSKVYRDLSLYMLGLVSSLPFSFVQKHVTGDIIHRVKEDTRHSADLINAATEFITIIAIISLSFTYLLQVDAFIALLCVLSVIIIFVSSRFFDRRLSNQAAQVEAEEAIAQHNIQQYIDGIGTIKHYSAHSWLIDKFLKHQVILNRYRSKLANTENMADSTAEAVFSLAQIIALAIIALAAARNSLTPGTIITCSLLFELVVWPVLGLSRQWSNMQKGAGGFQRIYDWISMEGTTNSKEHLTSTMQLNAMQSADVQNSELQSHDGHMQITDGQTINGQMTDMHMGSGQTSNEQMNNRHRSGEQTSNEQMNNRHRSGEQVSTTQPVIALSQVQFLPDQAATPILDHITLQIKQGEIVAIVGASGAGKSALCKLCAGLYTPTDGTVLIGGRPVEQLTVAKEHITYVSQTPAFFTGTIKENIALDKLSIAQQDIVQAAQSADLHSFIEGLAEKYNAPVHEKGSNLSGGQRQRLSLSRAFLRQSQLYIFDEPTSSLDRQAEQNVIHSLFTFLQGKTAMIVTHNMELARQASRILVLDKGSIVEDGSHEQLMARQGLYYQFQTVSQPSDIHSSAEGELYHLD